MFRILIIDDDKHLLEFLKLYLSQEGYYVETTPSPIEGLKKCYEETWDLVLVDYYMDDMNGNTFLEYVNNFNNNNPVAIFTCYADETIEIEVLNNYAIDFIRKRNDPKILLKRIENILGDSSVFNTKLLSKKGNLILHVENRTLVIDEKQIKLSNTEFNILKLLLENKNRVLKREFIYNQIWKEKGSLSENTRVIDVHILSLRRKINLDNIITKQGVGYMWKE